MQKSMQIDLGVYRTFTEPGTADTYEPLYMSLMDKGSFLSMFWTKIIFGEPHPEVDFGK